MIELFQGLEWEKLRPNSHSEPSCPSSLHSFALLFLCGSLQAANPSAVGPLEGESAFRPPRLSQGPEARGHAPVETKGRLGSAVLADLNGMVGRDGRPVRPGSDWGVQYLLPSEQHNQRGTEPTRSPEPMPGEDLA